MKQTIAKTLYNREIDFIATLIREPIHAEDDDWRKTAHEWRIVINSQEFEYFTGIAHRENKFNRSVGFTYKELKNRSLADSGLKHLLATSKPKPPTIDDVLYSLVMDSDAAQATFEEWCDNLGYDYDSIKAFEAYRACQNNANKLHKTGLINMEKARVAYQDF